MDPDSWMGGNMNSNTSMATQNTNNSNEDYGNKGSYPLSSPVPSQVTSPPGLDFLEKINHTLSRDQNEKITDGARGLFKEMTGKKVDPKYSN